MSSVLRRPAAAHRRLLAAGAGAGLILLLGAAPALAGPPTVSVASPSNGSTLSTASPQITGTVSASSTGGVISGALQITVTSSAGHPGFSSTIPSWCGQSTCSFTVTVKPGLAYNGLYQLSVDAQESDPPLNSSHSAAYDGSFSVNAPPVAPQGVTAQPAADGSSITVTWDANPEPDIVGYQVSRSPSSGAWPAAVTGTSLTDSNVTPGTTYTYAVTAVRRGATSGSVLYSSPSSASATDPTVTDASPGSGSSSSGGSGTSTGSGSSGTGSASPSGTGTTSGSGSSTSGSSSSGSTGTGSRSGQPTLGTYGKAPASSGGSSQNLSSFDQLVNKTQAQSASSSASSTSSADQGMVGAPLPPLNGNGVAPGSDNPTVAPFSSGSSGTRAEAGGTTVSYATAGQDHNAVVRDFAAVALAALLLAVVTHLLWLRHAAARLDTQT
ncbi:MAG: fibronectin type III domain-containing protein [Acidimicrobiales bacterium]